MNAEVHNYFKWIKRLKWSLDEVEAQEARIRSEEDWWLARMVGGSILLAGVLVLGLMLTQVEPVRMSKKKRAMASYGEHVELNQEEWIHGNR